MYWLMIFTTLVWNSKTLFIMHSLNCFIDRFVFLFWLIAQRDIYEFYLEDLRVVVRILGPDK